MIRDIIPKAKKKTYTSPRITQVAITSHLRLMEGSYHHTLGQQDSRIDDMFA